jgi:stage II sporulation protein D
MPRVSGTAQWRIMSSEGRLVTEARPGEVWRIERQGATIRAVRPDGAVTPWSGTPLHLRSIGFGGYLLHEGKRFRGDLVLVPSDSGVAVVNHTRMDDYLKGVVPLEIGRTRTEAERAAVEAQAVAARSYAFTRVGRGTSRPWDLRGSVLDQVYGGVDAETPVASRAVEATAGLVIRYGGRAVDAPYSASCGGSTAAGSEVWRAGDQPYLQRVSDRIPGTAERYWCDAAPRFRWTTTFDRTSLNAAVSRYLRTYASVPPGGPGTVRAVTVTSRTPSGRVGTLELRTDRGSYSLRGNEIRFVLRSAGGEILNSTYFSHDAQTGADGVVQTLTLRGNGNGHGVGMCQWGAIGRARAGQDFRTILQAYYRGTTVGMAY